MPRKPRGEDQRRRMGGEQESWGDIGQVGEGSRHAEGVLRLRNAKIRFSLSSRNLSTSHSLSAEGATFFLSSLSFLPFPILHQ